jgi:two-component system response regulator AtoC
MKILIVDDEADLREILVEHFKFSGFEVAEASEIKTAFSLFQEDKFDVVLTDMRMPGGTGIELIEKIRLINKKIPLLIITGFADINENEAILLGATKMMSKPFDLGELLEVVKLSL